MSRQLLQLLLQLLDRLWGDVSKLGLVSKVDLGTPVRLDADLAPDEEKERERKKRMVEIKREECWAGG